MFVRVCQIFQDCDWPQDAEFSVRHFAKEWGEIFFVYEACGTRQKASMEGQQQRATSCKMVQSYLFTWLFVKEMQSDLGFDKVFTPVRTKSCCVTECMQDGAWLPTEAIRTVVAIASSAIVLTGVTSPYTNSGGLQSKFHAGTGSIRKSEEMCECVLMYWMLSVPSWVSSNYKLRAEQTSMSLFLALIACKDHLRNLYNMFLNYISLTQRCRFHIWQQRQFNNSAKDQEWCGAQQLHELFPTLIAAPSSMLARSERVQQPKLQNVKKEKYRQGTQ